MTNIDRQIAIDTDYDGWAAIFEHMGHPSYRAAQVCNWIWKRRVSDPHEMTDLGKSTREELKNLVDFSVPVIEKEERSRDGTRKFLVSLSDSAKVETALLKHGDRLTACISTQVGCPVGCPFCVTATAKFERNLSRGEIAYQLILMENHIGREIGNVVFMGMGEPLLNSTEMFAAIKMLNDPKMRGLGIRHMTVSTSGIIPGIDALAQSGLGVRLAVSLHTADDELRDELVPCNSTYPIAELMDALKRYQASTGDRITIEYALFKNKNDSIEQARDLIRTLKGIHVYINLIPANYGRPGYERSDERDILRFQSVLKSAGFESEIRVERGADINAACGQLKGADRAERESDKTQTGPRRQEERKRETAPRHRAGDDGKRGKKPISGGRGAAVRPKSDSSSERGRRDSGIHPERNGGTDIRRSKGPASGRGRNSRNTSGRDGGRSGRN